MTEPLAVSVKTAAEMLDVHPQLIYAAINRLELPAKRFPGMDPAVPGKIVRINVDDLREWFDSLEAFRD